MQKHKQEFIGLTNELLNRNSAHATSTGGIISSAVSHGDNYDQDSVSAGEDNAGQIVLALMSFRKLKEEYDDYKGGLLLIDEADAGLFPTAQVNLLKILDRECKNLNLQVVMTSHSPVLIEYAFEQSQAFRRRYKTVYLSNTFGDVQVMHDWSWAQINADINTRTISSTSKIPLPEINVYFEDGEAADIFSALMNRQPVKKHVRPMAEVSLGCTNYLELIKRKVPEFAERSIICLDADTADKVKGKKFKTIVLLPGGLPPDQLLFQHLFNLPPGDDFWKNDIQFTRDVFTRSAAEVLREFAVNGNQVDVKERLAAYQGDGKPREIFKRFYKDADIQIIVTAGTKPYNPWKHWVERNPEASNTFLTEFKATLQSVMSSAYAVDASKLAALDVKLKKVS